jgi:hypothetical protein
LSPLYFYFKVLRRIIVDITQDEFKVKIKEIFKNMEDLLIRKNSDYGNSSFSLGNMGSVVHLWDKMSRFKTLYEKSLKGENPLINESMDDTLKDIIGYSVIGLIILEGEKIEVK